MFNNYQNENRERNLILISILILYIVCCTYVPGFLPLLTDYIM